jgi:hypothetical protein
LIGQLRRSVAKLFIGTQCVATLNHQSRARVTV